MAVIHNTTMSPTKLELLAEWLPQQDWYAGPELPELHRAGGFRLDDPAGAVGIEFMIVCAVGIDSTVTYSVPMTYRDSPIVGSEAALIGTSTHGALGERWIYDALADPVFAQELDRLQSGVAAAQHQSRSYEADPTVEVRTTSAPARVVRVLTDDGESDEPGVTASWTGPDGVAHSSLVVAC